MDSIELQIGQQNSLTLQSQNRFQESHSSDRLLPPRNATPNDSMSSSGSNIAMLSGKEKSNEESNQRIRNFSFRENTVHKNQDGITIAEMQRSRCKSRTTLNEGTEDELIITGYRFNLYKSIFIGFLFVITAGLLWLFLYWMPKVRIRFTHDEVDLGMADTVLVEEEYGKGYICVYVEKVYIASTKNAQKQIWIPEQDCPNLRGVNEYRFFRCKKVTHIWDSENSMFFELKMLDSNVPLNFYHLQNGLSLEEQRTRQFVYGANDIKVPYHSIGMLLVKEVLNPFYVFQIASVILWLADEYYYYAVAIVVMSVGGIVSAVYQTRKNQKNLRSTIQSSDVVMVRRENEEWEKISSEDLVPGDVILIPPNGCEMTCDAVLISGTAIVNESMLTGESVPISKTAVQRNRLTSYNSTSSYKGEERLYDSKEHSKHTLFRGTSIIQTRNHRDLDTVAVVIRTGFSTLKGKLVRSILYPLPVDFKFEQDSYKFIGFLTLLAGVGFVYTWYRLIGTKGVKDIFLDAADLITIVIPPALPAAITIGSLYAENRLKRKGIYCISPRTINVSGSVNCVCFDKTGTLTEDGLDLMGVVQITAEVKDKLGKENMLEREVNVDTPKEEKLFCKLERKTKTLDIHSKFVQGMATCHSLTTIDGKLSGDPIDVIMFEGTGWTLEETMDGSNQASENFFTVVKPKEQVSKSVDGSLKSSEQTPLEQDLSIGIIRQFQFSSERQCMSVVVRVASMEEEDGTNYEGNDFRPPQFLVFCKGSPEKIKAISETNTIPVNFNAILDSYTEKGYRVIAIASKVLPSNKSYIKIQRMERSEVESNLEFLGLIVLENRIKKETKPVIKQLQGAKLRTIMITGDHIQTAVSVAKECKMIPTKSQVIFVTAGEEEENISQVQSESKGHEDLTADISTIGDKKINSSTIKNTRLMKRPYITYYQVNLKSETSSSEISHDVSQITDKAEESEKVNSGIVIEIEELKDSLKSKYVLNKLNIENDDENRDIQFAIDGASFDVAKEYFPDDAQKLRVKGTVFARMSPDQKESLIGELQHLGYYVAMCGDGANDCGALKKAHAGISLSEAEASVASPFTSKEPNISCVPELIREGRCALVTSFGIFKYMAAYSLTQFASVLILYDIDSNLSDIQFLYIDLFLITVFAFFFGLTKAYEGELAKQPPNNSLIHFLPIMSILLQLAAIVGFQILAWFLTLNQEWYVAYDHNDPTYKNATYFNTTWKTWGSPEEYYNKTGIEGSMVACWENYSVFSISAFQYTILAYAFSKSVPYRKWVLSNYQLMASFIILTSFTIYLVITPARFFQQNFELLLPPSQEFRYILLGFAALNICICVILEDCVVEIVLQKGVQRMKLGTSKSPYKKVLEVIRNQPAWPQLSSTKLPEGKRERNDVHTETREAILQLENIEILDENYVYNNYFGSIKEDETITFPSTFIDSSASRGNPEYHEFSSLQHHEHAALVLNKSYNFPERVEVIEDTTNRIAPLASYQQESQQDKTTVGHLYEEDSSVENEELHSSAMADYIKEYST